MKIAMISDVHEQWHNLKVPECDLLISAGDYSYLGKPNVVTSFHKWLHDQPATHIISVQGNHEVWVEKNLQEAAERAQEVCPRAYFIDEGFVHIEGFKIWCSAVQPTYGGWAWNVDRGEKIRRHWDQIPTDTDILVTHGPPYGILDNVGPGAEHLGCVDLAERIKHLTRLQLHVFGHIHGGSGQFDFCRTRYINASICDENYKPTNPVRVYETVKVK